VGGGYEATHERSVTTLCPGIGCVLAMPLQQMPSIAMYMQAIFSGNNMKLIKSTKANLAAVPPHGRE